MTDRIHNGIYRFSNRLWGWLDEHLVGPIYQAGLDRAARKYQKQRAKHFRETVARKTTTDADRRAVAFILKRRSKSNG